ncbi:MAG TPA: ROK family protein [Silvibacterium sp.]|nr:ROK family protein [Silvibacterium sp.]
MPNQPPAFPHPITMAVDIGGTGMKVMALDARGNPLSERLRTPTPDPATPTRMLAELDRMRKQLPKCDRVSVGFPGVIKQGKTLTAANLHPTWVGFPLRSALEKKWKLPVHLANDAAVQGYGAISGRGVELVLTLGTGLGSALFTDGHLCPGLELGHHPWQKGQTYEDYLGRRGLKKHGKKRWNRFLAQAIEQTCKTFNWDRLYLGGGNAKEINFTLPTYVSTVSNEDGLFGGVALWRYQ